MNGRITAIDAADGASPVLDLDYALYDLAGNIKTITDAGGTGRDRSYVYDELHRLTDASGGIPTETYGYDPRIGFGPLAEAVDTALFDSRPIHAGASRAADGTRGNRTGRTVGAASESYAYDAASNRLLSVTGAATRSLTYSDSGNTAQDDRGGGTVLDYAYDSADRLIAVTQGAAAVGAYVHNAMGQRVAKTVGGATTHFLYDLSGRLIGEADGATGAATAEYVWLEGMPLAFVTGGAIYYVHTDHLGTPQRLTDGTKAIVWDASYTPFGGATVSGSLTFNLRFPGQYEDVETGLNYNYFRDYDPALGRYVQSDPIGLRGGWNVFAYVGGNPVMAVDPLGLEPSLLELLLIGCGPAAGFFQYYGLFAQIDAKGHNYFSAPVTSTFDKYYHCMANCKSASFSELQEICAEILSDLKEAVDLQLGGGTPEDSEADQVANRFGRAIGRAIREQEADKCEDKISCDEECKKRYPI